MLCVECSTPRARTIFTARHKLVAIQCIGIITQSRRVSEAVELSDNCLRQSESADSYWATSFALLEDGVWIFSGIYRPIPQMVFKSSTVLDRLN